jgi:hypothetical protein
MAIREKGPSVQEAEAVIRRVPGVSAARVEAGEQGGIGRIHVLAAPDRSARLIAADIVAALASELGLRVEPAQVRVASLKAGQTQPGPAPFRARLKLIGLTAATHGAAAEVRVRLEDEGLTYEGAATGRGTADGPALVAAAALRAVETYLRCDGVFHVKAARVVRVGEDDVAVVLVAGPGPGAALLCGSAAAGDDPRQAMARALLDAMNRPLSWLAGR